MVATEGQSPMGTAVGCRARRFQMKQFFSSNEQILPRPPEKLPNYADARARQNLAEKLVSAFELSEAAAAAFANAEVDPSAVRRAIGDLNEVPNAERIAVPGGKDLGLRAEVC